jgi:mannose-6-phosphate isomerase-like protein (cupin superfamily)
MNLKVRRVVTGKDSSGKAVVISDADAEQVHERKLLGVTNCVLWSTNSAPAMLSESIDGAKRELGITPPRAGTILRIIEFGPQNSATASPQEKLELFRKMGLAPEGAAAANPRDPGMHRTRTIDYVVILSGEIDMLLDDSEVHLRAGDVVIQRGTNHVWVNRGTEVCRAVFVLLDAAE